MNESVTESKYDSTLKVVEYIDRYIHPSIGNIFIDYTVGLHGKIIGLIKGKPKNQARAVKNREPKPSKLTQKQVGILEVLAQRITKKKEHQIVIHW